MEHRYISMYMYVYQMRRAVLSCFDLFFEWVVGFLTEVRDMIVYWGSMVLYYADTCCDMIVYWGSMVLYYADTCCDMIVYWGSMVLYYADTCCDMIVYWGSMVLYYADTCCDMIVYWGSMVLYYADTCCKLIIRIMTSYHARARLCWELAQISPNRPTTAAFSPNCE